MFAVFAVFAISASDRGLAVERAAEEAGGCCTTNLKIALGPTGTRINSKKTMPHLMVSGKLGEQLLRAPRFQFFNSSIICCFDPLVL